MSYGAGERAEHGYIVKVGGWAGDVIKGIKDSPLILHGRAVSINV